MRSRIVFFEICFLLFNLSAAPIADAQDLGTQSYAIGAPVLTDIWVDPTLGNDAAGGTTRATALRTIQEAWNRIPIRTTFTSTGYRILLTPGDYPRAAMPNYWESRYGTAQFPVILQAADGRQTARLHGDLNVFDVRYFYLIDADVLTEPAGDAFHCERCDHVLIRGSEMSGGSRAAQETVKVNQSQYVFIEESDIHGANDNNIDFVGVQYGHIVRNRIHDAQDWCHYLKGGSAYFVVEGNEYYDCGTGGFTAGQGTGFEFMQSPWTHYEAYDIKFINNVIHDTEGAGFGVNGGYNILLAYNTMYRVGSRDHGIEVVFGARSCDGDLARCNALTAEGGWGPSPDGNPIPDRNVYIFNNILYNPAGVRSLYSQFAIYGPRPALPGTNVPSPARTDSNLRIEGNIIWNGPAELALGVGDDQGCTSDNPTCNEAQLRRDNAINLIEPQLIDPAHGDFRPLPGGNVFSVRSIEVPSFAGGDRAQPPLAPAGNLTNDISRDRQGHGRGAGGPPGAYGGPIHPRVGADVYLPWNGYLKMVNILELVNRAASPLAVRVSLYDSQGNATADLDVTLASESEQDVIVNDLPGFAADTYGLVTVSAGGSAALDGRLTVYRPNTRSGYDFAFSLPFLAPLRGGTSVPFNTYNPSRNAGEQSNLVSNWLTLINLDTSAEHGYTVRRFTSEGVPLVATHITVAPFGRFDLDGGHQNPGPGNVGLNEIVPDDDTAPYVAELVRYGSDAPPSQLPTHYLFATPFLASRGASGDSYAAISTGGGAENWLEIANAGDVSTVAAVTGFLADGSALGPELAISIPPHAQRHVNTGALLGPAASGSIRVRSSDAPLLVHAMFYFHSANGSIDTVYGSRAMPLGSAPIVGSYNLYLGMYNWLKIINPSDQPAVLTLRTTRPGAAPIESVVPIAPRGAVDLGLHERTRFGLAADTYGLVSIDGGAVLAQVIRFRPRVGGGFEFAVPTEVR